jgi:PhoPQ-activated pathogenicity-related protein
MSWQGTPQYRNLMKIEEPYEYRNRLTMPKFIINATGDQFFLPDSWQFYWNDLPGVKHLRYVPNAEHSMQGPDAFLTVLACYNSVITGATLPDYSWSVDKMALSKSRPRQNRTQSSSEKQRIWRTGFGVTSIGPKWTSTNLKTREASTSRAGTEKGYTAYHGRSSPPERPALARTSYQRRKGHP